jgi:hypothetical protein
LTEGSSGNQSVRLEDGWLLTPSNASLGRLDPARLAKLDWNGKLLSGDQPSKEAFLHRAMYQEATGRAPSLTSIPRIPPPVSCTDELNPTACRR